MADCYPMTEVSEGYPWTLGVSKTPVFVNPIPFEVWLHGFKCYDKYLAECGDFHRRVFLPFWYALCSPQDVCARCYGCGSPLECVIDTPFKGFPSNEDETFFTR